MKIKIMTIVVAGLLNTLALAQQDQATPGLAAPNSVVPTPIPDPVPANASLKNKRLIRNILSEILPKAQAKVDGSTGTHIPFDIDWVGIASSDVAVDEIKNSINAIANGFSETCKDSDGKSAVVAKIKSIRMIRGKIHLWTESIVLTDGVLTVPVSEEQFKGLTADQFAGVVTKLL